MLFPEVVGERGFQSRVTLLDVQGVAVVGYVEQVGHARLLRGSAVVDSQVAHLREPVSEVECGREVGHVSHRVHVHALEVLQIVRALRLHHHAGVELELGVYPSVGELNVVQVVGILRVSAQRVGLIAFQRSGGAAQVVVPAAVGRHDAVEEIPPHGAEVVGGAVALVVRVLIAVAQLQEHLLGDGLAVGGLQVVAPALRWRQVVAVGLVG